MLSGSVAVHVQRSSGRNPCSGPHRSRDGNARGCRYLSWKRRCGGVLLPFVGAACVGRLRQEVERFRLARNFGGAIKSCLADRCYAESCLVGRCYTPQISRSLRIWTDERRAVAPLGAVVASTDVWTGMDDADLFPEDGSVVR
ncbi:Serine/threonine-protein kinase HT1 [Hordeum vulgare]|nr:Serine/threonine-protein kinase HT1 [Hordeum vulgare]